VRALQPHITFNDRYGNEPRKKIPRPSYAGDYEQTEQNIPREGLRDDAGQPMPWEAWLTLTNSWCYSATDHLWKSPSSIIRALVNCVSKDGNLLLNVSPDARGQVPAEARRILGEIGGWLDRNGDAIYGATAAPHPKPEWGRFTQRGNNLYAHLFEEVIGHICLPAMRGRVRHASLLASGAEMILCDYWNPGIQTFDGPDDIFLNFTTGTSGTYPMQDLRDTVVRLELNDEEASARERRRLDEARSWAISDRSPF